LQATEGAEAELEAAQVALNAADLASDAELDAAAAGMAKGAAVWRAGSNVDKTIQLYDRKVGRSMIAPEWTVKLDYARPGAPLGCTADERVDETMQMNGGKVAHLHTPTSDVSACQGFTLNPKS